MRNLDTILEEYLNTGSDKQKLKEIKERLLPMLNQDISVPIEQIIDDLIMSSETFLHSKTGDIDNITALSSGIYLPSDTGTYNIRVLGGKDNNNTNITNRTLFDVASITKLFTLIFTFKLDEVGVLDINRKVSDYLPEYIGLEDFTIKDLLLLCGEIYTDGNIAEANSKNEAEKILKTAYLKSNDRTKNKYTDFGAIIIGKIIEKVVSEDVDKDMTLDEIMQTHIFKPFGLDDTTYSIDNQSVAGNGLKMVHDPKAKILGPIGSAGIFTNGQDLNQLAKKMYNINHRDYMPLRDIISSANLEKLSTITFPNGLANRGYLGMHQKISESANSFAPTIYSEKTFAAQGWTGSIAIFDSINKIHNNILVSTVRTPEIPGLYKNNKPIGYKDAIKTYEEDLTKYSLMLQVLKKYYEREFLTIDVERHIR